MRRYLWVVLVVAMVELAVARSAQACKSDTDCKGDRVCEAGKCVSPKPAGPAPCKQDKDCSGDDVCEQSFCMSPLSGGGAAAAVRGPAPAAPVTVATTNPAAPTPAMPAELVAGQGAPAPVPPSTGPAATTTSAQPQPPTASPAGPTPPNTFKSFAVLKPNIPDYFGLAAHVDQRLESWSGAEWCVTGGASYQGVAYIGEADFTSLMNVFGVNFGIRPANPKTVSFALRGGAVLIATTTEIASQKNTDFTFALSASGDLMLGYLMIGAEAWLREGSTWLLRAGFAW